MNDTEYKYIYDYEKNTTTIDMFGSAKYRNYQYGGDDHVAIVHTENVPMKAAIFVTSACHKSAHTGKFDYGHNFYAKDADALDIMLPAKATQKIRFSVVYRNTDWIQKKREMQYKEDLCKKKTQVQVLKVVEAEE